MRDFCASFFTFGVVTGLATLSRGVTSAQDPEFQFGFANAPSLPAVDTDLDCVKNDGPPWPAGADILTGVPGSTAQGTYFVTLEQLSAIAPDNANAAQGWQLSWMAENAEILDVTSTQVDHSPGAVADCEFGRGYRGGFDVTELATGGAVSGLILHLKKGTKLPELTPKNPATVARFLLQCDVPIDNTDTTDNTVILRFVDGLQGSGLPLDNKVTQFGKSSIPALIEKDILCSSYEVFLELLDPIPDLLPYLTATYITSDIATLASEGLPREGVAADGVARLVLRISAPASGVVEFELLGENKESLLDHTEYGALTTILEQQSGALVRAHTHKVTEEHIAVAVYIAPQHFVREKSQDHERRERQVYIYARLFPLSGEPPIELSEPVLIRIVRPPVLLVHGIWSRPGGWANFRPLVNDDSVFTTEKVDYEFFSKNGYGFDVCSKKVYNHIRQYMSDYKTDNGIAVVQADAVAHSMGAPVLRYLAVPGVLSVDYLHDPQLPTFGKGPIRRLITIGGVHLGTPLANILLNCSNLKCVYRLLQRSNNGAITDLTETSAKIAKINSCATPFGVHTIVGLAGPEQKDDNKWLIQLVDGSCCRGNVFRGFDNALTIENDLLVPGLSQRGGLVANSPSVSFYPPLPGLPGVVHSLPFSGLHELRAAGIADRVIELLDSTDVSAFSILP